MSAPRALSAIAVVGALAAPARADDVAPPTYVAARVATAPVIDGRLDDAIWTELAADARFTQEAPREGAAPSERTEIRIGFDDDALYVGALLHDAEPGGVRARLTRRDREVEADWIRIAFDSRGDREGAFVFALNAAGVQSDGVLFDDTSYSGDWDAVWDGAAVRHEGGWSAEMRIPLAALRFSSAQGRPWGLQVERYIARKKERISWRFTPSDVRGEATRMGVLEGVAGLAPERVVELRPYLVGRVASARPRASGDLGVDAKVGVTSELVVDATINPDFGQLEADPMVLNLTRFETFLPEKRVFFLEGLDVMASPLTVFYSRRIGRAPSDLAAGDVVVLPDGAEAEVIAAPDEVALWAAAKLAGNLTRRTATAVLVAVTGPEEITVADRTLETAPPRLWAVARGRIAGGGSTYVGAHATLVHRLGGHLHRAELDHDALVQSIDGQWQAGDGAWRAGAQVLASARLGGPAGRDPLGGHCRDGAPCLPITRDDGTRLGGDDLGWGARATIERFADGLLGRVEVESLSPALDLNGIGFQTNHGVHHGTVTVGHSDAGGVGPVQRYAAEAWVDAYRGFDGSTTWLALEGTAEIETWSFWRLRVGGGALATGTWDRYETAGDGGRVQRPGAALANVGVASDPRHLVAVELSASAYRDLDRPSRGVAASTRVAIRPGTRIEVDALVDAGLDRDVLRFRGCLDPGGLPCTVDDAMRAYTFAGLDSASLSTTVRASFALSPRLSIQGGGQLFLARGAYADFAGVATTGASPRIRFADLVAIADAADDGNFVEATVDADLHLRWERAPGSVVFLGYRRRQSATPAAGPHPSLDPRLLRESGADQELYLKWVHYLPL